MRLLNKIKYADDDTISLGRLFLIRIPSLLLGLILGLFLAFVVSEFRAVLEKDVEVAYFIPLVVYMAAAVGSQTQNIYTRDLLSGRASFKTYMLKESALGVLLGLIFSLLAGVAIHLWLNSIQLTMSVFLGMFGAIMSAPIVSLVVADVLELEHSDPAVGAGPIATVIQDTVSVLIYGLVCSAVFL